MYIERYCNTGHILGASGLFSVCGSFGRVGSEAEYTRQDDGGVTVFTYESAAVKLVSEWTELENGVIRRKDYLKNLSGEPIQIYSLFSRFTLVGNDYEVYTQYSGWQHESTGAWQRLTTQITASAGGVLTCNGATPMLGLHNVYTGKNTVFHLLPNCQWKMTARKFPLDKREIVLVETGIEESGLCLTVEADERIDLPEVFFYQAESKTDLDAYKMHAVFNRLYPRKRMPVVYNSWLHTFEWVEVDELKRQADAAAELGFEVFVVDAGWFGTGDNWLLSVGDWTENATRGTKGRLKELSDYVREKGMRFGLWFEPERASLTSEAFARNPQFYMQGSPAGALLDFANDEAREYILEEISAQIERYSIGYVKFDFNAFIPHDPRGSAFYRYMQGHRRFISALKERFPDLHISNCAGGGSRMEMGQATYTDSFWFTDNQGPYEGLTIIKDTLKRLPTACIERWNVQKYMEGFPAYNPDKCQGLMVSCNNATWDHIVAVSNGYTQAFMTGGTVGFSCDVAAFPEAYKTMWKEFIDKHKKEREFYAKATARILIDTPSVIAIQYADPALTRIELQLFTKLVHTKDVEVYPVVDKTASYTVDGRQVSGKELAENGLYFDGLKDNDALRVSIIKEK